MPLVDQSLGLALLRAHLVSCELTHVLISDDEQACKVVDSVRDRASGLSGNFRCFSSWHRQSPSEDDDFTSERAIRITFVTDPVRRNGLRRTLKPAVYAETGLCDRAQ